MDTRTNSGSRAASIGANSALLLLAVAAGAGAAYFADPDRGAKRRSSLRRKAQYALGTGGDALDRVRTDLRKRARNVAAKAKAFDVSNLPLNVTDSQLVDRVRMHISDLVADAREIAVRSKGGIVELIGSILMEERDRLLAAVRGVPGVRDVVDRMHTSFDDDNDGYERPSPFVAGTVGTALLALGLARRGRALPAAFLGAGILAKALRSRG